MIAGAYEETFPSDVRSLPTPDQTAGLHMVASEECAPSVDEGALGGRGCAGSSSEQKPEYMSVRAEAMMQSRSKFSSDVDHKIEHSKVHWSEVRDDGDGDEYNDARPLISEFSSDDSSGIGHSEPYWRVMVGIVDCDGNNKRRPLALQNFEVFFMDTQWTHAEKGNSFCDFVLEEELGQKMQRGASRNLGMVGT